MVSIIGIVIGIILISGPFIFKLVEDGRMSPEVLEVVSRELLPLEMYVQTINQNFQQALDALEKG